MTPSNPDPPAIVPTRDVVVGLVLVVLGVGTHVVLSLKLSQRSMWDLVALIPVAAGAHLISRGFIRDVVEAIKARFGGGGGAS